MLTVVPTAADIRSARNAAGLTQRESAALLGYSSRRFGEFEQGRVKMRPAIWELLQQKLGIVAIEDALKERLRHTAARFRAELGMRQQRAVARERPTTAAARDYRQLLRLAMATCEPEPTLQQVADWCGFSVHALRSWLRPPTNRSARPPPKYAMRLILWELSARDRSGTDWIALFAACR